ncbi:MAG: response regulator [Oligoflexia bacterium]|nr:response regulator [Oligoflexia bacterium]
MIREEVNVLVVDDVATIRAQVKEFLKNAGFRRIFLAKSVEEAKTALHEQIFNLVICDWHMTPANGLELLKHVRSEALLKDIPFVMLTADSTKEHVMEAIRNGVDGYMIKPVNMAQIQTKIFGLLLDKKVLG